MDCIFCKSEKHESKSCKKYVDVNKRKEIADKNRFCHLCFVESVEAHLPEDAQCKSNENCYGWYSTEHHTIFCPERIKVFKHFIPIDKNLLQRFLDMVDIDEKYFIATSTPSAPGIVNFKPIKIMDSFNNRKFEDYPVSDIILLNNIVTISKLNIKKDTKLINCIASKTIMCLPKILIIKKSKLSADMFYQLLSSSTKLLNFDDSKCKPNISFTDIIKKAPKLESIYISDYERNILNGNSWLDYLLKFSNTKRFQYLDVKVDEVEDIDVEKLIKLVPTKCTNNVAFYIRYDQNLLEAEDDGMADWKKFEEIGKKLLNHFDDIYDHKNHGKKNLPHLYLGFDGVDGYQTFSLENIFNGK